MLKDKTRRIVGRKAMSYFSSVVLGILAACLLSSSYAEGATSKPSEKSSDVEIKIESTLPRLTAGGGVGVTAEIRNRSDKVIWLDERYVVISLPPEISPDREIEHWITYFPTEHPPECKVTSPVSIAIAPGESYKLFCFIKTSNPPNGTSKNSPWRNLVSSVLNKMRLIFFVPGDYSIDFTGKYWIDPKKWQTDPNKPQTDPYHTMIASRRLTVDAPQFVILFGAMIGGLISYFLLPQARRRLVGFQTTNEVPSKFKRVFREVAGFGGAALLSAIVAILLSRISETQFLIRVTVSDFWGAVAIGFVANYAGAEVLNKIIKRYSNEEAAQKTAPTQQTKENGN